MKIGLCSSVQNVCQASRANPILKEGSLSLSEDFKSMFPAEVVWGLRSTWEVGIFVPSLPLEAPSLPGTENPHRRKIFVRDGVLQTVEVRN